MTRLERNARLHHVLRTLAYAYDTGNFTEFVALLAEDCVYESMWVLTPLCGREAVAAHLLKKGSAMKVDNSFPKSRIVELVEDMRPSAETELTVNGERRYGRLALACETGKFALVLEQELDGESNEVLVDLKLTEDDLVSRIDICVPTLFHTADCDEYVSFRLGCEEEEWEHEVIVSSRYFGELRLAFAMVGEVFSEYDDIELSMETWERLLAGWEEFVEASDFDAFLEKAAGVRYESWTAENEEVLRVLGWNGDRLWQRREKTVALLDGLLKWTREHRDRFGCVQMIGW